MNISHTNPNGEIVNENFITVLIKSFLLRYPDPQPVLDLDPIATLTQKNIWMDRISGLF